MPNPDAEKHRWHRDTLAEFFYNDGFTHARCARCDLRALIVDGRAQLRYGARPPGPCPGSPPSVRQLDALKHTLVPTFTNPDGSQLFQCLREPCEFKVTVMKDLLGPENEERRARAILHSLAGKTCPWLKVPSLWMRIEAREEGDPCP